VKPETARRLAKADRFLKQAQKQSAEDSEATIHLAYYAMLHAAAAADRLRNNAQEFVAYCRSLL
jgi:uncharacterized protein (UPF0332 family)